MTTDIIIYAACGVMVLAAVVFPLINIMFRRPRTRKGEKTSCPSFSIIIPAHDNAYELERHLPCFLEQQYEGDFEIIIVESKTGDRTDEVLAKYADDKRLYSTFIPSSSRYMSRKKLAMTVGAKAAKYDWLIFADAECYPKGNGWLEAIAAEIDSDCELAIGYGNYCGETSAFHRFIQLRNSLYALRRAAKGTAHMAASDCIAIKRDVFIEAKGFEGNLMYVRGEYDYLVNKFATKSNTAVITSPDGWMMKDEPTVKSWKNTNLFRIDTMKHLQNKTGYRLASLTDTVTMYMSYLLLIVGLTAGIVISNLLLIIVSALSLIVCITERTLISHKTSVMYGEQIPIWEIVPFEIMVLMHDIKYRIKYALSNKLDFISHKL